jgi:hypothetical protein
MPPPKRSRSAGIVVGVVVVVVLLAALLLWPGTPLGTSPFGKSSTPSSSSSSSGTLTYDQAYPIANRTATSYNNGQWVTLYAVGHALVSAPSISLTNTSSPTNCSVHLLTTTTPSFPPTPGNRTSGGSNMWAFFMRNAANTLLIVTVLNGQGLALATITNTTCTSSLGFLQPVPARAIDSSEAAANVDPYARSFLAAHPQVNATYDLMGGVSIFGFSEPSTWQLNYSTCPINTGTSTGASVVGSSFNATVNALTGQVIYYHTAINYNCISSSSSPPPPTSYPLSSSLVFGSTSAVSTKSGWQYTIPITYTAHSIEAANLSLLIINGTKPYYNFNASWQLTLESSSGAVLAVYNLPSGSWSRGSLTLLAAGQNLVLVSPQNLSGWNLEILGLGQFNGFMEIPL